MKKLFYVLILMLSVSSVWARSNRCDLQVYMHEGVSDEPASYFEEVKDILIMKGYTNIEFVENSSEFKKLVLFFGIQNGVFNFQEQVKMTLSDETKLFTSEKYLFSAQRNSYWSGVAASYLKLLKQLPSC